VALEPDPLNKLIDDVVNEKAVGIWPLLAIETPNDCINHFEIVYMEPVDGGDLPNLAQGSVPMDADLRKVCTGLTLRDVLAENSDWSEEDKEFFCEFLSSARVQAFLAHHYEHVQKVQTALREHGSFLQKWEAQTWAAGCHPLQEDKE
jgi:hypothetical protein